MSAPWWTAVGASLGARLLPSGFPFETKPDVLPGDTRGTASQMIARAAAFTPGLAIAPHDPADALITLFAEQLELVRDRARRLPDKTYVEFLTSAGVQPLAAAPAAVLLEFTVSPDAPGSVLIPEDFQVSARPATGDGDLVVFETARNLVANPATIAAAVVQEQSLLRAVDLPEPESGASILPFGRTGIPGRAFLLGFESAVAPGPSLTIAIGLTPRGDAPPPVGLGGVVPAAPDPQPVVRWEAFHGGSFDPVEIVVDETDGLRRSGLLEVRVPRDWAPALLPGADSDSPLRWLRARIVVGRFERALRLSYVRINCARAAATVTVRDEALDPIPGTQGRRFRLSRTPVVPNSLAIEVDEPFESVPRRWTEVDDLAPFAADARVFALDAISGEVTFGDGVHGLAVPSGFRQVRAVRYRVGGGAAGAVEHGDVDGLLNSVAFVTGVSNIGRATGGRDGEPVAATGRRGPQEVRALGRAVTVADFTLFATQATGALVARAHAVSGLHPAFRGSRLPGVVGVFVVPPDPNTGAPPIPDEATLAAVAEFLSSRVAPAGVQVVAAPPQFHRVRAEVGVLVSRTVDTGTTIGRVLDALNTYLHPLRGGEDGQGWPFGGALRYTPLLQRLLAVDGVRAIPRLTLFIDGLRLQACTDRQITPHALLWPGRHEVLAVDEVAP
jgi:predicted phage baseplate assembly protein